MQRFMFATGIENSYPTIENGSVRIDEMEKCGHYEHWETDFELSAGARHPLPALRAAHPPDLAGPGRYDWDFADPTFGGLKSRDIVPIVDLCHFGVPDWIGNFQNPDFPALFADYAARLRRRFPWVQLYTPVNEMFICATFSAAYGWWNEQLTSDQAFVTALKHLVKANVLAMHAILDVRPGRDLRPERVLRVLPRRRARMRSARPSPERPTVPVARPELRPARRLGDVRVPDGQRHDAGRSTTFSSNQHLRQHCIMGNDYYVTNEHRVRPTARPAPSGEVFGYDEITRQYYDRYELPVMHTETNLSQGPTATRP